MRLVSWDCDAFRGTSAGAILVQLRYSFGCRTMAFGMMCGVLVDEVENMVMCRKEHRNGPTGKVQLAWLEQYTKFASLARRG